MPQWTVGGAAALHAHAPTVLAALNGLVAAWPDGVPEDRLATIRTVAAEGLGLPPLRVLLTGPRSEPVALAPEVMAFAEQFAVDVSVIDDAQRRAWFDAVGELAFETTFLVWVADYVPRTRTVLNQLFGPDAWFDVGLTPTQHTQLLMDEFLREVALLDGLDPVTTELVRLRGARQHTCRICMSRRSLDAVRRGADAVTFESVDTYRSSDLTAAQQAALALTDAIIWTPAHLREQDLAAVRAHLTPAQAVEVVLDVMRNSANKIAVALGADQPEVDSGVQLFEHDGAGGLLFP
jgi:alkylhydroperoxidase family enzyme